MAPLCRFWQQGTCRNGNSCKFEHIGPSGGGGGEARNTNRYNDGRGGQPNQGHGRDNRGGYDSDRGNNVDRYRPGQDDRYRPQGGGGGGSGRYSGGSGNEGRGGSGNEGRGGGRGASGGSGNQSGGGRSNPSQSHPQRQTYGIDREILDKDLRTERPQWIFSSYGPSKDAPIQLFGGPQREQSFEEMRLRHYIAAAQGHPASAIEDANELYREAEKQMQAVLNDPEGAIQFISRAENEHPNRHDILKQSPQQMGFTQPPTPGQQSNSQNPTQGPAQNPTHNPFAAAAAAAFGEPDPAQPKFGEQIPLGPRVNLFQPPAPAPNIGNTGSSRSQPPPQPSVPNSTQPNPNPFYNPFASPLTPLSSNPFNKSQAPPTGTTQQPSQSQRSGQPQAFANSNPLPQAPQGETKRDQRGLLTMWHGRPVTYVTPPTPPSAPGGDKPVALPPYPCYKRDDGLLERINFPNGRKSGNTSSALPGSIAAQGQVGDVDMSGVEGRPEEYTDAVRDSYEFLAKNGIFKDGIMPAVPPKREWINWDF